MKTLTKKQWEVIYLERRAAIIGEFNPDKNLFLDIIPMLKEMGRLERQLHRLAELDCNGYPKQVTEYRDGKMFIYNVEDEELRAKCEKKEAKELVMSMEKCPARSIVWAHRVTPTSLMGAN